MIRDARIIYTLVSSRSLVYSNNTIKEAGFLLCIKFSQDLTSDTSILNIGECTIGRDEWKNISELNDVSIMKDKIHLSEDLWKLF